MLVEAREATRAAVVASADCAESTLRELSEVATALREELELPRLQSEKEGAEEAPLDVEAFRRQLGVLETFLQKLLVFPRRGPALLFMWEASQARLSLLQRLRSLRASLCRKATEWLEGEVDALHSAWIEAQNRASAIPSSEEELLQLKNFLAVVGRETEPLVRRGKRVFALVEVLENACAPPSHRLQKEVFQLCCKPMQLKLALCETNGVLEHAKERVREAHGPLCAEPSNCQTARPRRSCAGFCDVCPQLEAKRESSKTQLQEAFAELIRDVEEAAASFNDFGAALEFAPALDALRSRVFEVRAEISKLHKAEELFGLETSQFEEMDALNLTFDAFNEVRLFTNKSSFPAAPFLPRRPQPCTPFPFRKFLF